MNVFMTVYVHVYVRVYVFMYVCMYIYVCMNVSVSRWRADHGIFFLRSVSTHLDGGYHDSDLLIIFKKK